MERRLARLRLYPGVPWHDPRARTYLAKGSSVHERPGGVLGAYSEDLVAGLRNVVMFDHFCFSKPRKSATSSYSGR